MKVLDILLLFAVGSILGVVIETIYCYLTTGKLMRRQSVVYGPFNQIYGIGAVLMTTLLSRLPDAWGLFLSSAILGGLFEAVCSYVQETMYGTVSWEYSGQRFSLLGGRTSLRFMIFWGFLGIAYIRGIQPFLFRLFAQIPFPVKAPAVIALNVFLAYDLWLSALAVGRWRKRLTGHKPDGQMDIWLDQRFPNERMQKLYPSMRHSPYKMAEQKKDYK
ncbi:hypothetical protein GCM10008910_31490 [Faecalicatena orotica]|uniref:Putative ABC transporter type IV n=1 Tax=Faecalicatena orotica TaxID=1544 RepID=A0A2Y9BJB9_9FIRM|nr:putative ABC transporter permease [Faecalicatena orotica]PWJ22688.1 putative ABC transporter type IV [Faecalicatena orotica]SSA58131.1 Putative ABC-transporter type IV [Faecalicatena orotica]